MISTKATLLHMPKKLQAFKKYIEEYICTYFVSSEGNHTIIFYTEHEDRYVPYVLLVCDMDSDYVEIYVNKTYEDISGKDAQPVITNLISNDMVKFLEAINKCIKEKAV